MPGLSREEAKEAQGRFHRISVEAYLDKRPEETRTKPISVYLHLMYSSCAYEELVLIDSPFQDMMAQLNDDKVTIWPDFNQIV